MPLHLTKVAYGATSLPDLVSRKMGSNACHHPTQLVLPLVEVSIATLSAPVPLGSP